MSKTLNMLFEIGGSRLYDSVPEAHKALVNAGFRCEEARYRYYPDESEVDEAYQSGWIEAAIRVLGGADKFYLEFEFVL